MFQMLRTNKDDDGDSKMILFLIQELQVTSQFQKNKTVHIGARKVEYFVANAIPVSSQLQKTRRYI